MNKTIVLVLVLLAIPIVSAEYLTDRIYCKNFGTCNLDYLSVSNLNVSNSVVINVSYFNVTGGLNLSGGINITMTQSYPMITGYNLGTGGVLDVNFNGGKHFLIDGLGCINFPDGSKLCRGISNYLINGMNLTIPHLNVTEDLNVSKIYSNNNWLNVMGNLNVSRDLKVGGLYVQNSSGIINMTGAVNIVGDTNITGNLKIGTAVISDNNNIFAYGTDNSYLVWNSSQPALYITNAKLGIGTTDPATELDIVGSVTLNHSDTRNCNTLNQVLSTDIDGKVICITKSGHNTSGIYVYNTSTTIYFNETRLNQSINNFLTSIIYLPTENITLFGTNTGGNNIGNLSYDDDQHYNVSEISGTSPLTVQINFTNVVSFNNLDIKERYDGGSGHEIGVYLWDYTLSEWEIYADITDQSQFYEMSIPVPDGSDHISGGKVQMMFNHTSGGITSHNFYIEYVNLKQSIDSQNIEHDSLSGRDDRNNHPQYVLLDGSKNITGVLNITNAVNIRNLTITENSTTIIINATGKDICIGNC